ncbi:DEAD/DEAH box helicase [Pedobacter aquatilis]|uniref:DEAD/DEAH box helicase n=1 Tax=Pedobacter aquatilis TaxID=351343 RepID=UPI002930AD41|nr:DEAD/DEAH box helicase [Pedobacter aquatilis]
MDIHSHSQLVPANKKKLHEYQKHDLQILFQKLAEHSSGKARILYQLPTGGGKTVIFSEIAKRFLTDFGTKVIVLTHRIELCKQTTTTLKNSGVINKVVDSKVKAISNRDKFECYVAMVETLKRRIKDGLINTKDVGLVIVDEAHHNSFHKLLGKFENAAIIGVTATPLSSDINLPMNRFYDELILGEQISSLIEQGFLAKPKIHRYDVELNSLLTGLTGDFTVNSSDTLYGSAVMLDLLLHAYQSHSVKKKTVIFNNGVFASKRVEDKFKDAGLPVRHLDNTTSSSEREEILKWFKKTTGAILTSVSILTTGFDEPSIRCVILNRATTSLTLYHQMIGRGSRISRGKKTFTIIDLGNNIDRFGDWDSKVDWNHLFAHPEIYYENLQSSIQQIHFIPAEMRNDFSNTREISFDVVTAYQLAIDTHQKPRTVIRDSIRQHALMCINNCDGELSRALALRKTLDKEIDYRIKQYGKCLLSVTTDYLKWLGEDYRIKVDKLIQKLIARQMLRNTA